MHVIRFSCVVLIGCLLACSVVCDAEWSYTFYNDTGKMVISGNGTMTDLQHSSGLDWADDVDAKDVKTVLIEYGVTSIGSLAFFGCSSLTSVTISSSVKSIGLGAFSDCESLEYVFIPKEVERIDRWAFRDCSSLRTVYYFGTTPIPDNKLFTGCDIDMLSAVVPGSYSGETFGEVNGTNLKRSLVSGNCSNTSIWVVDTERKRLLISGTDKIGDEYNSLNIPWASQIENISEIIIQPGINSISNDVFGGCTAINLPSSLNEFGDYSTVTFKGEDVTWIIKKGDSFSECQDVYDSHKQSVSDIFSHYHVFDSSVKDFNETKEFSNKTAINRDTTLTLAHYVKTENELVIKFYLAKGQKLKEESRLKPYFGQNFMITNASDERIVFTGESVVTGDVTLKIKALCSKFENASSCKSTVSCTWNEDSKTCSEEVIKEDSTGLIVALSVVGAVLIISIIVVVVIVIVRRQRKKELDDFELESLDGLNRSKLDMIEVNIKGKKTKLKFDSRIGKGAFATVWKAASVDDGTVYAVKVIESFADEAIMDAQKEALMLKRLDTNYVVGVYDCYEEKEIMAIVMDYFELGSLEAVLKKEPLAQNVGMAMLYHICRAMEYLHGQNIIHRDLKPGNVLVCSLDPSSPAMCKISDFGEARGVDTMEKSMTMTSGLGTPYYMAPEMMNNSKHYSSAIDVYSFGIMAAQVMVGKLAFGQNLEFDTPYAFAMMVLQGLRPGLDGCPQPMQVLIQKCWDGTPANRPSFTAVLGELNAIMQGK